jgi:hypothetical protein
VNPGTGRKEFVESLVDARKLKVYWDAQDRANLRIAEELGELPQRAHLEPAGSVSRLTSTKSWLRMRMAICIRCRTPGSALVYGTRALPIAPCRGPVLGLECAV